MRCIKVVLRFAAVNPATLNPSVMEEQRISVATDDNDPWDTVDIAVANENLSTSDLAFPPEPLPPA